MAATRPSASRRGGICTSTIATSGRCASVLRSRSSASPACATTSSPAPVSMRAMPSRSSTSSSPIATRRAPRRPGRSHDAQPPSMSCRSARSDNSSLGKNPHAPARRAASALAPSASEEIRTTRGGQGSARNCCVSAKPSPSGSPMSTSAVSGRSSAARVERLLDAAGLADHHMPPAGQHPRGEVAERGVVVDDEHRAGHRLILAARLSHAW